MTTRACRPILICGAALLASTLTTGCADEKTKDAPSRNSSDQQSATPVIADNDSVRLRIHDAFLTNYEPIPYVLEHSPERSQGGFKGFEADFVSDRYNTGFTSKNPACPDCYSFSASFFVLDQSGEVIQIKCYPTLDLATGSVVEWNPVCARFFRAKHPMAAPRIRRTNNFIGLKDKSKQKMEEYMFAIGEKYVEDPSGFDNEQELPCSDFTHTCWRIVNPTSSGNFEWRYDETNDSLFPMNRLAEMLQGRVEGSN
jgi:hypothetical protein